MIAQLAGDAVVVVHFAFIVFVVLGGVLAWRNPMLAWLHVPAALWGAYAELTATICPLTPLENALRASAGQSGYTDGFVEHYLMPLIYPVGLTPEHQHWIGALVIAINVVVYAIAFALARRRRAALPGSKTA
jgi:Protein of Unknown function (DUF2784)